MHVIALIDDTAVIRRILEHLGRWAPRQARQNQRAPPGARKRTEESKPTPRELTYHHIWGPDLPMLLVFLQKFIHPATVIFVAGQTLHEFR